MVIWEVLGKSSVALPCFPDKLAVQRGSRCGTVDAAGPGSPGVSWEHGAGGLGDSLGHPPPGQAGASVVGPSLRCCVPLPTPNASCQRLHRWSLGGVHGGPFSSPPALKSSVGSTLKSVVAAAPRPTLLYPISSHVSFLSHPWACHCYHIALL